MRAAYYERKGPAREVLTIGDIPSPALGFRDVRVQVHVSAINPSDTKQREGWGGDASMPYPRIVPHNDGAGVIVEVGAGVDPARMGEHVWVYEAQRDGRAFGTAAEEVVVPEANAIPLPGTSSFEDGASLGVPGMTAHRLLFADGGLQGRTVLVQGGAGSVGHLAVQLARWAGARVIATVGSDEQASVAAECGAHLVLNYKQDDLVTRVTEFTRSPSVVDRVVEVAFAKNLDIDARVLKPGGVISTFTVADDPAHPPALNLQQLLAKNITVHFALIYAMDSAAHRAAARDLNTALSAGALKPRIARRFRLNEVAEAHELLGTGGMGGKAVLSLR